MRWFDGGLMGCILFEDVVCDVCECVCGVCEDGEWCD